MSTLGTKSDNDVDVIIYESDTSEGGVRIVAYAPASFTAEEKLAVASPLAAAFAKVRKVGAQRKRRRQTRVCPRPVGMGA